MLLLAPLVHGLHIKGGWMSYQVLSEPQPGVFRYRFNVRVYRDCAPPNPGQNDAQITITVFRNDNNAIATSFIAGGTSTYTLQKGSFNECINPRPVVCYVILEYEGTVDLPALPAGYTASFQRCCRINGIVNITQPSNNLGNTYTLTIPGSAGSPTFPNNSSPRFSMNDTVAVCYDSPIELDYSAVDPDGDSLVYEFTPAILGGGQGNPAPTVAAAPPYASLPYASAYSPNDPFGTGLIINRTSGIITGRSPTITGEYVVAVLVTEYRNGKRIAETRKELHVNVANCALVAANLPPRIIACTDFNVSFENNSASPAILNYYWDFGVASLTNDTSVFARPTYNYPDTGTFKAKLVVNRGQSCSDSAFTEVRVYPGFNAGFTVAGSCFLNPWQFTDTTRSRYGIVNFWRWNFGDPATPSDTSRLRNPTYTYPAQGSYPVTMEVGNDKGCIDTVTIARVIPDKPTVNLAFRDTLICSIDSLQLRALGNGTFSWSPQTRMVGGSTATPTVFPVDTIVYRVTINDNGCINTDSVTVNVLDFIDVDAGPDITICRTDGVRLNPISQALGYQWSPAGLLDNPNTKNPIATPTDSLTTMVVRANLGKCEDRDSLVIRTVPYPIANAGPDTTICYGDAAILRGNGNGTSFRWEPTTNLRQNNTLNPIANPLQATTYRLLMFDTRGCPKPGVDTVVVNVRPRINVFAGNDTTIVFGQPLQLNGMANPEATIIRWTPVAGFSNSSILNPMFTVANGSPYEGQDFVRLRLNASTPEGCQATDEVVVRLFRGPAIYVPSAFTPNGDGRNDAMRPVLAGMRQMEYFRIYNRYGQLVFETREQGKGWNGTIGGVAQPNAAFVYNCKAIDYLGNPVMASGTFILVR